MAAQATVQAAPQVSQPQAALASPAKRSGILGRLQAYFTPRSVGGDPGVQAAPGSQRDLLPDGASAAPVTMAQLPSGGPADWRQSWARESKETAKVVLPGSTDTRLPAQPLAAAATPPPSPGVPEKRGIDIPSLPSSRAEAPGRTSDPISNPNVLSPQQVEAKLTGQLAAAGTKASAGASRSAGASGPPVSPGVPLGAQSVLAAQNPNGPVRYIPVPIVTMPEPNQPPGPPPPQMPGAPQLNYYVNAFSPSDAEKQQAMTQAQQAQQVQLAMMQQMAARQAMMAQGYPGGGMPPPPPMMGQGGYPYPPPPPPGMYLPQMAGQPMPPMMPQRNVAEGAVPPVYRGPLPPNPFGGPQATPVSYNTYAAAAAPAMPYANQAMDRQGMPATAQAAASAGPDTVQAMVAVLRTSLYPSQRELAAVQLASLDWRTQPQVLHALLTAAREDPAATVRAGCLQAVRMMNVNPELVRPTFQALRTDADAHVRQAAEEALARLGPDPGASPGGDPFPPAPPAAP